MAENVATQPAHTGIPISEFLAGRGEPPPPAAAAGPHRHPDLGVPRRSRRRAHCDVPGRRPAPRPRSHGAWRPCGSAAPRPRGPTAASTSPSSCGGTRGPPASRPARARAPADAVRRMLERRETGRLRGRGPARRAHRRKHARGRRHVRVPDGRWMMELVAVRARNRANSAEKWKFQ